jgi:hypothetical protein
MPPKRKTRNLPNVNDKEKINQVNKNIFFLFYLKKFSFSRCHFSIQFIKMIVFK